MIRLMTILNQVVVLKRKAYTRMKSTHFGSSAN